MKKGLVLYFLFIIRSIPIEAQGKLNTVGIQVKPIFPNSYVVSGTNTAIQENVTYDVTLHSGLSMGMVIRHGFSDLLALESGINYIKRSYKLRIVDENFTGESRFRIVGYEIPVNLLVFIRLGEKMFMNASMGPSLDMFASDVQSQDYYFTHRSYRNNIFQPAVTANMGCEYRTPKSGYFYLGVSYHRPFSYIYVTKINYQVKKDVIESLAGNYLTIDIRYFFYEDPKKKVKKTNSE